MQDFLIILILSLSSVCIGGFFTIGALLVMWALDVTIVGSVTFRKDDEDGEPVTE